MFKRYDDCRGARPRSSAAQMSFDPYKEWFRIPPARWKGEQGPDFYILLGLRRFESDANRIHEASLQRMKLLRQRQTGARAELTQRLMNEVSQARLCLGDPTRKAQYDFELEQRHPRQVEREEFPPSKTPAWLILAAGLLVLGGGAATYFAVMRSTGVAEANSEPVKAAPAQPETPEQRPNETTSPETNETKSENKSTGTPEATKSKSKVPAASPKPKTKAVESRPALVKLRDLKAPAADRTSEGDIVHLAALSTDADEEDPTFLDPESLLLAFQRKAGGKTQFLAVERAGPNEPFGAEYMVQGLPKGVRLQGFALEPSGRSCLFAAADGKGLLQARRPNTKSAWGVAQPLIAGDESVKAAWPSLTADGKELF